MALPEVEWLAKARSLAIGMTARVRHRGERRPNMVVGNDQGHWWAFCQACKQGGRKDKEHVLLGSGRAPEAPLSLDLPTDLRPVRGSDYEALVGRFLASKGMDGLYLPKLWYSENARRLCVQDDAEHWHGRDLTERSGAKWLHYMKDHLVGEVGHLTVVTEDIFSLYKVRFALRRSEKPVAVCSTLGAGCSTEAALALKSCKQLVWAYDGDAAGDNGYASASKRMRPYVPKQYRARPPEGQDPKDMQLGDIRRMIEEALR